MLIATIVCAIMAKSFLELAEITHMWVETIPVLRYSVVYVTLGIGVALWGLLFFTYFITSVKNLVIKNYQVEVGKIVALSIKGKSGG